MQEIKNKKGDWVPAIEEGYSGLGRVSCRCGRTFWGFDADEKYRGHYALVHILAL